VAIQLSIVVADITSTLAAGYTHIKIYRSAKQASGFTEITIPDSIVLLEAGKNTYSFTDKTGTTKHFYTSTFFDSGGVVAETALSNAFVGTFVDLRYSPVTYPKEFDFTSDDYYIINRVRLYLGDSKELNRDHVSSATGYDSISEDGFTHTFSNPKGWPLKVELDGIEYTTLDEPRINDFQFVTFSGVAIDTTSGTLDVWYDHFRHADSEILVTYNGLVPPPPLTEDQVTFELAAVCTALELLENELRLFGATSSSEVDIFQEIRINPKGGVDGRLDDIKALRERKNQLIAGILDVEIEDDLFGVQID
jgi:hypothetical protein